MPMKNSLLHLVISRNTQLIFLLIASGLLLLNQWHMVAMHDLLPIAATAAGNSSTITTPTTLSGNSVAGTDMLPHGVPARYGTELGVNFDDAASAMPILENFDRGPGAITLTGDLQQRYIAIASQTACEFCCGATTLVFSDGKPACGCAHSA